MSNIYCGIDLDLSIPIIVGNGTSITFSGWCYDDTLKITSIEVIVDNRGFRAASIGDFRHDVLDTQYAAGKELDNSLTSGFWAIIDIEEINIPTTKNIQLKVILENGEERLIGIGDLNLLPYKITERVQIENNTDDLVTICMATYNPKIELFKKQIDSICNQKHDNWICIINDDCSDFTIYNQLVNLLKNDQRFYIYRNNTNLGFYRNFERVLSLVPENTNFIALSDQDDIWHEDKLIKCLTAFNNSTSLVYSDMRIVNEQGKVISNTYWTQRKNNYKDINGLLLANTITGAASVFKKELLLKLLPFPERIGDSFHDWWIGLCAIMDGEIEYVNEPIYDYVQHGQNVIGQSEGTSLFTSIKKTFNKIQRNKKEELKRLIFQGKAIYEYDYKRVFLTTSILLLRFEENRGSEKYNQVLNFRSKMRIPSMFTMYLTNKIKKVDTVHAELRLILAFASDKILKRGYRRREPRYINSKKSTVSIPVQKNELTIDHLYQKIAPLQIELSEKEKIRINMLVPTVDFKYFFGGYIGKFNLALKLAKSGYAVRMIIIDYADFNVVQWKKDIQKYSGLEEFFEYVEIDYYFDRSKKMVANPNDRFLATTWWTAYVAQDAVKQFVNKKFIYLIQEYEPLTFEHGAYYALANETYNFDHFGIFSTELLREHFKLNKIGVFKDNESIGEKNSISFQNAILSFDLNKNELEARKRKKLIYYSRPEAHASRNMFELGILALNKAIELGAFDNEEWDLYGMGSVSNYHGIKINDNVSMKILPKMNLDDYKEALKDFDIGISLMYTPHPSLVPQEMASAGMLVITNSYANKTEEKLKEISSNFIVAKPTIEDVALKILEAVKQVNDIERRYQGSKVNWSSDWEETFNNDFIQKIREWIL